MLGYPSLKLAIEGNTDSVGTEAFNQQLSEQRAEGVRAYLTQQGVPESSTTATGFGKTRPSRQTLLPRVASKTAVSSWWSQAK